MTDRLMAAIVIAIVVSGIVGMGCLLLTYETEVAMATSVNMTITTNGNHGDVAYGVPERGFWGDESGIIDWEPLPMVKEWWNYKEGDYKRATLEYWFRERFYNGTEWVYSEHGPFFVDWPQLEYYEEIELNNHTVYIEMKECQ